MMPVTFVLGPAPPSDSLAIIGLSPPLGIAANKLGPDHHFCLDYSRPLALMDPNPSGKRPFSFQKLLSANQSRGGLARQPFVPIASKDASKSLDSSSTRVFTQKSRPLGLANADLEVGGTAKKPSGNAQSGPPVASQKQMFRGVSVGLQGFAPPEQRNFADSTSYASAPSSSPSKLDDAQTQLESKHHYNEEGEKITRQPAVKSVERQSSRPPVSQTRASLPGKPILDNDSVSASTDPPPMDYAVFQSLVVSRSNAVRELKSKEKEVIELKNEIEALNIENEGLTARVEQLKTETRGYIQNCQNLLSTVQKEGKAFQEDAQEAYQRCIDDLRGGIPQVERISSELQEKMDEIQGTLITEQQNKESIRGELLHQLEEAKHEAVFLRDKLTIVMEDYQDAKSRIADLEQASLRDKVTLRQTLDLLETTRADITILHNKPRRGIEDEDCIKAVEEQHQSKLNEYTSQVAQLQKDLSDSQNDIAKKQQELDRITFLLRASNEKVSEMEKISHQLEIKQALVHSKETELAILQVKHTEATAQLLSLQTTNDENLQLKLELAEVSRRNDTLESKQSDYISVCAEQRELAAEAEKELTALKNQYSDAKTRLEIVTADAQRLENRCTDVEAVFHATKKELVDLQHSYAKLEQSTKDQSDRHSSSLQVHLNERLKLEELLKTNLALLTKTQEELSQVKLQAEWTNDPEKVELKSQIIQLKTSSSIEKDKASSAISMLEGQLQASKAVVQELRSNIETIRSQQSGLMREKGTLLEEKSRITAELDKAQSMAKEAALSLAEIRSAHDATLMQHTQSIEALQSQHNEINHALIKSRSDYETSMLRVQLLESQLVDTSKLAEERLSTMKEGEEKWRRLDEGMEHLVKGLSDAKISIQKTSELTAELAKYKGDTSGRIGTGQLEKTIEELNDQVDSLTSRNKMIEAQSTTVLERHRTGKLNEHESALVKEVVASTRHMNEWDLAQKTNELKRRDMTIQSLQARIKELEKQLAARLDKSPVGQLITMKDLWSSSPLSNIDETNVSRTQLMAIAQVGGTTTDSLISNSRPTGIPELDSMSVPNGPKPHVSSHGSNPSVSAVDPQAGSVSHRNHHKENNGTFRNLNRAPSDDPDMDDIHQFSDKIHAQPEDIVATILEEHNTSVRVPIRRGIKRNRQDVEDEEDALVTGGLGSTTGTRVMRKRNPSQSIEHTEGGNVKRTNRPIDVEGKRVIGAHGRHGGLGENTSTAVARYKAAQRGKLRR